MYFRFNMKFQNFYSECCPSSKMIFCVCVWGRGVGLYCSPFFHICGEITLSWRSHSIWFIVISDKMVWQRGMLTGVSCLCVYVFFMHACWEKGCSINTNVYLINIDPDWFVTHAVVTHTHTHIYNHIHIHIQCALGADACLNREFFTCQQKKSHSLISPSLMLMSSVWDTAVAN